MAIFYVASLVDCLHCTATIPSSSFTDEFLMDERRREIERDFIQSISRLLAEIEMKTALLNSLRSNKV